MRLYRIFIFDASKRMIGLPIEMSFTSDEAAVESASLLEGECAVEVWQRERLVARIGKLPTAEIDGAV